MELVLILKTPFVQEVHFTPEKLVFDKMLEAAIQAVHTDKIPTVALFNYQSIKYSWCSKENYFLDTDQGFVYIDLLTHIYSKVPDEIVSILLLKGK